MGEVRNHLLHMPRTTKMGMICLFSGGICSSHGENDVWRKGKDILLLSCWLWSCPLLWTHRVIFLLFLHRYSSEQSFTIFFFWTKKSFSFFRKNEIVVQWHTSSPVNTIQTQWTRSTIINNSPSKSFTFYPFCLFLKYLLSFSPPLNIQMMKMNYSKEIPIIISCVTIPYHFNFPPMLLDKCVLKNTFYDTFITSTQFSHDYVIVIPPDLQFHTKTSSTDG